MLKYDDRLDRVFRALADPGRRMIVNTLASGPVSLGDLVRPLKMSLPAVHQHVGVLADAGLVSTTKVGRKRMCRLEDEALRQAQTWLEERRLGWKRKLDNLERHLAKGGRK